MSINLGAGPLAAFIPPARKRQKRRRNRLSSTPPEAFFCFYCKLWSEEADCYRHPYNLVPNSTGMQLGCDNYAIKTLPVGLAVGPSHLGNHVGLGVFCTSNSFPRNSLFGPMVGEIVRSSDGELTGEQSAYSWMMFKGKWSFLQNNEKISDWTRYVNSTSDLNLLNLVPKVGSELYYVSVKEIRPGDELLSYYGPERHKQLERGITTQDLFYVDDYVNSWTGYNTKLTWNSPGGSKPRQRLSTLLHNAVDNLRNFAVVLEKWSPDQVREKNEEGVQS